MNANTDTERVRFFGSAPALSPRGFELRSLVGKVVRRIAAFSQAFSAAQTAAQQANRYYAMSDAQLAKAGLTRDQIPAELIRVLSR